MPTSKNGYARDAAFYVRVAGSHPAVVMYSTSHNATGYVEGNNPDMIDGIQDPRPDWAKNGVKSGSPRRGDPEAIGSRAASFITILRATWARSTR